jgi:hypothetical protein
MTTIARTEPPINGGEAEILLAFLDYHRDTLRMKADGLDAAQLDQRLEPSPMTLGGMLKHLAYVEDWWLNQVFAGHPEPEPWASADWDADNDWDWHSATENLPSSTPRSRPPIGSWPRPWLRRRASTPPRSCPATAGPA